MSASNVGVVVVAHGSATTIAACVRSAIDQGAGSVVVVDNGSDDGTAAIVAELGARHHRVPNDGFAAACAAGELLLGDEAGLVLFLNPDAELQPGALEQLAGTHAAVVADGQACALNPAIAGEDPTWSDANRLWFFSLGRMARRLLRRPAAVPVTVAGRSLLRVEKLSGSALLVAREDLRRAGGWDSGFFLYFEDADLSVRLQAAGVATLLDPAAVIDHVGRASTGTDENMASVQARSSLRLARKHHGRLGGFGARADLVLSTALFAPIELARGQRARAWARVRRLSALRGGGARPGRGLKVAVFHPYPLVWTGSHVATLGAMLGLRERGVEFTVLLPEAGVAKGHFEASGFSVQVVTAPAPWRRYAGALKTPALAARAGLTLPAWWARLARALRETGATVVHITDHRGMLLAAPAARMAGLPVLWHVHARYDSRRLNALCSRLATAIAVPSASVIAEDPVLSLRARPTVIVGSETAFLAPRPALDEAPMPALEGTPSLLLAGTLQPAKGIDVLIRALGLLGGAHAHLAGPPADEDGTFLAELDTLARAEGVADRVHLLGALPQLSGVLAAADIYVQPSREETFGLALLEAMAAGRPVVASAVGGLRELVTDGVDGLLVKAGDPAVLAAAIDKLATDPELARRLGDAARTTAAGRVQATAALDALEGLYRSLADRGIPSAS